MEHKPLFKEGDKVIFTNDYGVCFGEKTIIKCVSWFEHLKSIGLFREEKTNYPDRWAYFYTPSDSPWFPSDEKHFSIVQ